MIVRSRLLVVLLASWLALPLAGCGGAKDPATNTEKKANENSSTPEAIGKSDDEAAPPAQAPAKGQEEPAPKDSTDDAEPTESTPTNDEALFTSPPRAVDVPDLGTRRQGVDWPKFLGPTSDSKSSEKGLVTPWEKTGPRIVWQRKIGEGYGIGSVSRGRYFQFDRYGDAARLLCLKSETGEELWKFDYPTDYVDLYGYNGGPRASPVVDHERVYVYGAEGMLHCLNVVDGSVVWKCDTIAEFGVIQNFFGVGSTPVIYKDLLLVMVGGSPPEDKQLPPGQLDRVSPNGSALVAFDKYTGEVRYKTGQDLASYASLRLAAIEGKPWCLAFCRAGLLGIEPDTGRVGFEFPWRARILESVNASTPVVAGDQVFISETYGVGSALLKVKKGRLEVVWQDDERRREKSFKAHWNTPVLIDGHLYGCSGRNPPDAEQRCIEWNSGKIRWTELTQIRTSLLWVDGHFVCLGEYGALQLWKVNPDKLEIVSEVKLRDPNAAGPTIPGLEPPGLLKSPCWAAPILSHGLMYVRGDDRVVCLEVIPDGGKEP